MDAELTELLKLQDQQELDPPDVADVKPIGEDVFEHGEQ